MTVRLANERPLNALERAAVAARWPWGVCQRCDRPGPVTARGERLCVACAGFTLVRRNSAA